MTLNNSKIFFGDGSCGKWLVRCGYVSKFSLKGNTLNGGGIDCTLEPYSEVQIGKDCLFSSEVLIECGNQHSLISLEEIKQINTGKSCINIGDHVWLGRLSVVMASSRTVNVGNGSIIGINSTLTRTIPETSIAVGCPAKVVRESVSWSQKHICNEGELERISNMFINN